LKDGYEVGTSLGVNRGGKKKKKKKKKNNNNNNNNNNKNDDMAPLPLQKPHHECTVLSYSRLYLLDPKFD
jgi:hypothetical protein